MSRPEGASPRRVILGEVYLAPGESPALLAERAAVRLGISRRDLLGCTVLRRSLDARGRREPRFAYRLGLELPADLTLPASPPLTPWPEAEPPPRPVERRPGLRPVVVGAGPAGLFAALRLAACGVRPLVLERGSPLEDRIREVARYWRRGELDPESNVQFGEGGAGTFSDGKLTYRGKDPRKAWVFAQLIEAGAPAEIAFDARPHLGTDKLRGVLRRLRNRLEAAGGELRFRCRVTGLTLGAGAVAGVETAAGSVVAAAVFLAPGHSARDLLATLVGRGVAAEAKGFAVGVRVELPQAVVDRGQYGAWAGTPGLPPAEFSVKAHSPAGRDVYSFCMCPGGTVIPAGSEAGGLVVNGMSAWGRRGRWANAALVTPVEPADLGDGVLAGHAFQRRWEERAALAGGARGVPAQRVMDFLAARVSAELPPSSCPWPVVSAELGACLPDFAAAALRGGLPLLFRQVPGLAEALLLGVETRTSSPVRLLRGEDLQSPGMEGLYPLGEGAGYAGGIVSAAVDGVRGADAYLARWGGGGEVDR